MICKKCNNELPEDSLFCSKCGTKTINDDKRNFTVYRISNKIVMVGICITALIGVLITVLLLVNNPINRFKQALNNNNYLEASKIYSENIKDNLEKEKKATEYLKSDIERIKKEFVKNKIEYNNALTQLETIQKTALIQSDINSAIDEINALNDSRTSFKKGNDLLKSNNYKDALSELKKVIKEDENYSKAEELINSSIKDYKPSVLAEAEAEGNKSEFEKAISLLSDALIVIPKDSDITSKKETYEKLNEEKKAIERKNKIEELQKNQEVSVVSSRVVRTGTYIDFYDAEVIVKNNTNKVVKDYTVGWLAYDSNNYPINLDSNDFISKGNAKATNIQPGQTHGSGYGWSILNNGGKAKSLISCVIAVNYYDGSQWNNPYYDYWLEEYKEKPLN